MTLSIEGEGAGRLPEDGSNPVIQAARWLFERSGQHLPGLQVHCTNHIPLGSGLGSSAAAVLLGLLGAGALLDLHFSQTDLLKMAVTFEGHPDNAAGALYGGLIVVVKDQMDGLPDGWIVRRFELPRLQAVLVLPDFDFPTQAARAALPAQVGLREAVFNLGRTALVVEALRTGDLGLLGQVMDDRLHQPFRLPLIPGAAQALQAACQAGAAAAVISGAGPSLIAFSKDDPAPAGAAMAQAFAASGLNSRTFLLQTTNQCAQAEDL
jgi:homoserine kinase